LAAGLKRGDVIIVSAPGEYGKPRPAVIVQRDLTEPLESVVVCPLSSDLIVSRHVRPTIQPSSVNGLRAVSQVMADKIMAIQVRRTRGKIGDLAASDMEAVDSALAIMLGLTR